MRQRGEKREREERRKGREKRLREKREKRWKGERDWVKIPVSFLFHSIKTVLLDT